MRSVLLTILWAMVSAGATAQLKIPDEILEIKKQIEQDRQISYSYLIEQRLENGEVVKTKGRIQKGKDYYFEKNDQQEILQTDRWFYKVDHSGKVVYVIDGEKVRTQIFKIKQKKKDAVYLIPDSTLLRHGTFDIKHDKEIVKVNISFSKEMLIKNIYVEYDKTGKKIEVMKIRMLYPYAIDGWTYEEKYMDQLFTADKFSTAEKTIRPDMDDYFTISKGKVKLKKYDKYELITEI